MTSFYLSVCLGCIDGRLLRKFAFSKQICYVNGKIAAVAFLKKDKIECKISTLYVKPDYRKQGIVTVLIKKVFRMAWNNYSARDHC